MQVSSGQVGAMGNTKQAGMSPFHLGVSVGGGSCSQQYLCRDCSVSDNRYKQTEQSWYTLFLVAGKSEQSVEEESSGVADAPENMC